MLAIEMSDARGADYASIHAAGCGGMHDAQNLPGEPTTLVDVANAVEMVTGWGEGEYDEDDVRLKPCAVEAMRKAAAAAPAVVEPDESTDVEPMTLGDEIRAIGGANPDHLARLADEADALQRRAQIAETEIRTALAGKFDAMTRATEEKTRAESLTIANRSLNEMIQHMTTRIEADEIRLRVAERSEVKIQDGQTWVSNEHDTDHQVAGPGDEPGTWAMWGPVGNLHVISEAGLRSRYTLDPNR